MNKVRIPTENYEFIRQITTAIGIASFCAITEPDHPYVRADRSDGLPSLRIYYGFTNGFTSEAEGLRAAGDGAECKPSLRNGTWYVAHPVTKIRAAGSKPRDTRREAEFCDCGMQLSLSGVCSSCD